MLWKTNEATPHGDGRTVAKPARGHAIFRTPGLASVALRCDDISHASCPLPGADQLTLWRLHAQWQAVSRMASRASISPAEHARAKHYLNPAFGKRYLIGRAALRHLLSIMLDCPADRIPLADGSDGQPYLLEPYAHHDITIHIAYTGIWILIAIGTAPMGIGALVPAPGRSPHEYVSAAMHDVAAADTALRVVNEPTRAQEQARHDSVAMLTGTPSRPVFSARSGAASVAKTPAGDCYVLDLPMPGRIYAAIALAAPVSRLNAIGWIRRQSGATDAE